MTLPLPDLIAEVYGYYQVLSIDDEDIEFGEITVEVFVYEDDIDLDEDGNGGTIDKTINIYELAFRIRNYLQKHEIFLDMNFSIEEIFGNANELLKNKNYFEK